MADSRFYDNRGPFTLADVCKQANAALPDGADGAAEILDLATLEGAGERHLSFCIGKSAARPLAATKAGFCFLGKDAADFIYPSTMIAIRCESASHAFAAALNLFYPENGKEIWGQKTSIDPSAKVGEGVQLAPGVVVGPGAEIGDRTIVGPNAVIGRGVATGRDCQIGSNVSICYTYIGDNVVILQGAQIGQTGFGFASAAGGHMKIPQIGRVIIQDRVEIGACTTVDRGALGDTVIGEGTKIDNLVQIAHNTHIGRHCLITAQVGIAGSCVLGDFVVLGGQAGVADHAIIGSGSRFAAKAGVTQGEWAGNQDYGGYPARPIKDFRREMATIALMARRKKKDSKE